MPHEVTIADGADYRTIVWKLLGRGMTMSQELPGHFVLRLNDIIDLIRRIEQRVVSQNQAHLSDFYAIFFFEDGSSERVPSLAHLDEYRSINNNRCIRFRLSFAFLLQFKGRGPEKQTIDIVGDCAPGSDISSRIKGIAKFIVGTRRDHSGVLRLSIEYTDVTWANDIKNLFEIYARSHLDYFPVKQFINEHVTVSSALFIAVPLAAFSTIVLTAYGRSGPEGEILRLLDRQSSQVNLQLLSEKIDVLIRLQTVVQSKLVALAFAGIIAVAIIIGFLIPRIFASFPRSAVLLSAEAERGYAKLEEKRKKSIWISSAGLIATIVLSVIGANVDRLIQALW